MSDDERYLRANTVARQYLDAKRMAALRIIETADSRSAADTLVWATDVLAAHVRDIASGAVSA